MSKKFWSKRILTISPYIPGEQPASNDYIKLNTNENPYPPSEKVIEAINNCDKNLLRKYPDNHCGKLTTAISNKYQVSTKNVFIGNGSDEVLAFVFLAFFSDRSILFPDISYSFYSVYASIFKVPYLEIPLNADYEIVVEDYRIPNGGVVIANPNAPTGIALDISDIRKLLEYNRNSLVVIDEAYADFSGHSAVPLVEEYDNLLVVQTFSKSRSLAGLRVGYAIGNENLIEALNTVKNSFNSYTLDTIAQIGALAAIEDEDYYKATIKKVLNTRKNISASLRNLGFCVLESSANFIFVKHPAVSAEKLYNELKANKILVRYFKKDRIDNFLRITIGTDEEMSILHQEITKIINRDHAEA